MSIPLNQFVFIIGAMKCGTTTLFETLIESEEICGASVKEPEYFSKKKDGEIDKEEYEKLWDFKSGLHKYALEASTAYTKAPSLAGVASKIKKMGIQPKIIYCVRNPFDRIISQYHFNDNHPYFPNSKVTSNAKIALSKYCYQLSFYRKHFDKNEILIVDFDEIKHNLQHVIDEICSFLNIEKFKITNHENKSKTPIRSKLENEFKAKYYKQLKAIPRPILDIGISIVRNITQARKKQLSRKEYDIIYNELKEDMISFKRDYAFPVEKWGFVE